MGFTLPSRVSTSAFRNRWIKVATCRSCTRRHTRLLNTSWSTRSKHFARSISTPHVSPARLDACAAGESRRSSPSGGAQSSWSTCSRVCSIHRSCTVGNPQVAGSSPWLRDRRAPYRLGRIGPLHHGGPKRWPVPLQVLLQVLHGHPVEAWGPMMASDLLQHAPEVSASSTRASRSVPSTGASSPRVPVTASAPESSRGRSSGLTDALPSARHDTTPPLLQAPCGAPFGPSAHPRDGFASLLPAVWSCVIGPLRSDCVIPSNSGTTRPPFKERPIAPASNYSQGEFTFSFVTQNMPNVELWRLSPSKDLNGLQVEYLVQRTKARWSGLSSLAIRSAPSRLVDFDRLTKR